ncbi:hypothetical protein [Actinacidiphila bryophytorum]|uniref:Secreted protein n=1 Tax=Actinacidiphila bryophytorum TaxID=1436133 RepID=A0A9W4E347_9ACTN|nr:hypothetical protein [Actinacidiphila bryophytorum]MBM9435446.1 hypothetical protein [Actinacidiphila bryophytorum]MBN6547606.1 hypothetical protein [Actinacidiphila bryophytorum]CAG7608241.1 conserved exported hypothetical protein [Actinacidiphila bryophytorum]
MNRTKTYVSAAAAVVALAVGIPTMAQAHDGGSASHPGRSGHPARSAPAQRAAAAVVPASVVAPGQRVPAGYGLQVWLTADGKYVQVPGQDVEFTPKVDGGQTSGINLQAYPTSHGWFVSGVFLGHGRAGRVEVTTASGTVLAGRVLQLAGDPGWGAFFVTPGAALPVGSGTPHPRVGVAKIVVFDTAGHVITDATYPGAF